MTVHFTPRPENRISASVPFNVAFNARAKSRGARFDGESRTWIFHGDDLEWLKETCRDLFGSDGEGTTEVCTLRVVFRSMEWQKHGPVTFHGRTLARAFGRDSGAKLGEDVAIEAGEVTSGGSVKNWETRIEAGTVLLLRNFPKTKAEALVAEEPEDYSIIAPATAPAIDVKELEAERDRLAARILEIERILSER